MQERKAGARQDKLCSARKSEQNREDPLKNLGFKGGRNNRLTGKCVVSGLKEVHEVKVQSR